MLRCVDWRLASPHEIAPLIAAEVTAWRTELDWDVSTSWAGLEAARVSGRLPGRLALDASGRILGWTCFVAHHGTLQVAVLAAERPDITELLVAAITASPEAHAGSALAVCVRTAAPGLATTLAAHGLEVSPYHYLVRGIGEATMGATVGRPWQASDEAGTAVLLADAYRASHSVRAFAPHDTPIEWADYVLALVRGDGCGRLVPTASLVCPAADGGADAVILTTRISHVTAHVAQVAVRPSLRRRGTARELILAAGREASRFGCTRQSLLVADDNASARRLYEELGFQEEAAFVVGLRHQPTRSSSADVLTGGASTRR